MRALRCLLLLLLLTPLAAAETIRTKNGQRLEGEIVGETAAEVVLRTRYGVLVIPAGAIEAIEGRAGADAQAGAAGPLTPAVDQARIRALRLKARRQAQTGKAEVALATYVELLSLDGHDVAALAEVCALHAQLGRAADAAAALRRAVVSGFTDLEGLRRDPRFAPLEKDPALEPLLTGRAALLRLAGRRVGARVVRSLRARGATAGYREGERAGERLVFVHALDERTFGVVSAELEAFVGIARRELFRSPPEGQLVIVLLAEQDRALLGPSSSSYDLATNTLTCAPFPFGALTRAPAAQRELARALHAIDQQSRRVRHPAWLEEGLVDLLGSVAVVESRLLPRAPAKAATPELAGLFGSSRADLQRGGRSARVAARALLQHLWTRDALATFYEQVAAGGEVGALEAVLREPLAKTEQALGAWLAEQPAPGLPFTGLVTTSNERGLRVTYVQPESGAARAHLVEADVVVAIDGLPVRSDEDLSDALSARAIGDEVEVTLLRSEQTLRVHLALTARPPGPIGPMRDAAPYFGVAVEQSATGVTVRSIDDDSPAARAALQTGDLLVSLDGLEVPTVRAWLRALRQKQAGQRGALIVERAGERVTVDVEFAPLGE